MAINVEERPRSLTTDITAYRWPSVFEDAVVPSKRIEEIQSAIDKSRENPRLSLNLLATGIYVEDSEGSQHRLDVQGYMSWLGIQADMHGVSYAGERATPVETPHIDPVPKFNPPA